MRLGGKSVIVTGASRGIGKAIALAFGREGASVVVDDVGSDGAQRVADEIRRSSARAIAVQADVTQPDQVQALVNRACEEFGGIDVMVNNAGFEEKHPFLEMPFEVFQKVVSINLNGVWLCSQAAARAMVARGKGGRIINISSVHEDISMAGNAPYCAAKGGVRMLMRTIAVELASHGITVNNICPGAVDTPMDKAVKQDPSELRALLDWIPLKRMAKPEEVAELCVYLASDATSYVTGSSYVLDGGMERCAGSL